MNKIFAILFLAFSSCALYDPFYVTYSVTGDVPVCISYSEPGNGLKSEVYPISSGNSWHHDVLVMGYDDANLYLSAYIPACVSGNITITISCNGEILKTETISGSDVSVNASAFISGGIEI